MHLSATCINSVQLNRYARLKRTNKENCTTTERGSESECRYDVCARGRETWKMCKMLNTFEKSMQSMHCGYFYTEAVRSRNRNAHAWCGSIQPKNCNDPKNIECMVFWSWARNCQQRMTANNAIDMAVQCTRLQLPFAEYIRTQTHSH